MLKNFKSSKDRAENQGKVFSKNNFNKHHNNPDVKESSADNGDKIEGRNPVIEALRAERTIDKILIQKGKIEGSILQIIALAKEKGIVIQETEKAKLDELSNVGSHQGVIAYVSQYDYVEVEDILEYAKEKDEHPFIVILDEITDPHNLGSVIRSANAAGVHGIIIPKRRAVGLSSVVAKSSAGAIEYAKVAKVSNISQTMEFLKKQGVWIVGTDAGGDKTYYKSDLKGPIAVVIGSEGEGMGRLVKENCDYLVSIPMKGQITSLNAGVAAGILMFEIVRQREKA